MVIEIMKKCSYNEVFASNTMAYKRVHVVYNCAMDMVPRIKGALEHVVRSNNEEMYKLMRLIGEKFVNLIEEIELREKEYGDIGNNVKELGLDLNKVISVLSDVSNEIKGVVG
jgi:hypothetical protein